MNACRFAVSVLLALAASAAPAATIRVPQDQPTIKDGLRVAVNGDTVMISPGTYFENNLGIGSVTVTGTDPMDRSVVEQTVVDGNLAASVFQMWGSGGLLTGLTIQRGSGGIYASGNSTIRRCIIIGNYRYGVFWSGGFPLFEECDFIANTGDYYGTADGMEINGGSPTVRNCRFRRNSRYGLTIEGRANGVNISHCIFEEQAVGRYGGGLHLDMADNVMIGNCLFRNNGYTYPAGGLSAIYCSNTWITNCTFTENDGDAIHQYDSDVSISNCILWGDAEEIWYQVDPPRTVEYSNIEGGWEGVGNIDVDPNFITVHGFESILGVNSPCIDAGDPAIEDGVSDWHPRWPVWYPNSPRSDMGAYGGPDNKEWIDF